MRRLGLCGALEQFRIRLCPVRVSLKMPFQLLFGSGYVPAAFGVFSPTDRDLLCRPVLLCGRRPRTHANAIEGLGVTASDVDAPPVSE